MVYIDEQGDVSNVRDSLTNPIKLAIDLIFILLMIACGAYIFYRTYKNMKIHRIPLVIRTANLSPWSYKQRFKLATFLIYMIVSTFFVRHNMYDLSQTCMY